MTSPGARPTRGRGRVAAALGAVVTTLALLAGCAGGSEPAVAPSPPATPDVPTSAPATTTTVSPRCSTATWSTQRRARSLVLASLTTGDAAEVQGLLDAGVGGLFVTSGAAARTQSGELADTLAPMEDPPLVMVDEEGGRVQRLRDLGPIPSARTMAATMAPAEIRALAAEHAAAMRRLGVTVDAAPVVDVATTVTNDAIGDRSFGSDPDEVTADAEAFARGLLDGGVLPTFKHFPGQGSVAADAHDAVARTVPLDQLGPDLAPYRALLPQLPEAVVMVGHLQVPGLTEGEPASVSPAAVTGLLRGELGFDGLVVTDDLGDMEGILALHPTPEAAALAVAAGVDMVLVPAGSVTAVVDAVVASVGSGALPDAQLTRSADRVLRARTRPTCT